MGRIIAKFNGRCSVCGAALPKGSAIEYRDKHAYCLTCTFAGEEDKRPGSEDVVSLAESLGYRHYSQTELDEGGIT